MNYCALKNFRNFRNTIIRYYYLFLLNAKNQAFIYLPDLIGKPAKNEFQRVFLESFKPDYLAIFAAMTALNCSTVILNLAANNSIADFSAFAAFAFSAFATLTFAAKESTILRRYSNQ